MIAAIVIQTDADFTPPGKRSARVVEIRAQFGRSRQLRWYVGGRIYRRMTPSGDNLTMTMQWLAE